MSLKGFSPRVRMQIKARAGVEGMSLDGGYVRCEKCGEYIPYNAAQIHHRLPRGSGSTKRPYVNEAANGLCLCAGPMSPNDCHAVIESDRDDAYANGWLISMHLKGITPAEVPVQMHDGTYLLDNTGERWSIPNPNREAS
jgi:5-methylcytosine-specific restriction protein A